MSFILDALRKSETERQRQSGPGLVDAGYRPPARRRGLWLPLLVVVLGANLVLMAILWIRRAPDAPGPAAAVPPSVTAPAVPAPVAAADTEFATTADMPAVEAEPVTETLTPPVEPAPTAVPDAPSQVIRDDLPTAAQLTAEGALPGEPLHLDIHVFSDTPAERFVFINMRRYTEGTQLPDGARVEDITRDGVILSVDGRRFMLTRD